jgi:hypothetical protein
LPAKTSRKVSDFAETIAIKPDKFCQRIEKSGKSVEVYKILPTVHLVVEEFPLAKQHLTADKRSSLWYYDADVYSLEGIGRFYIGLANHIHILKGAELEKYVKEFAGNWLK